MPVREYRLKDGAEGCPHCREGFERVEPLDCPPFPFCPECGSPVCRILSAPSVGRSRSGLDQRAKGAGFLKYEKLGKGEYEKKY